MNLKSKLKKNLAKNLILIAMLSAVGTFFVVPSSLSLPSYAAPLSNSHQMEEDHIDVERVDIDAERAEIRAERAEIRAERANINTAIDNINARRDIIEEGKKPLKAIEENIQAAINTVDNILRREARKSGVSKRLREITEYATGLLNTNAIGCIIESTDPEEFNNCFGSFVQDFIDNSDYRIIVKDDTEEEDNNNNNNNDDDPAVLLQNFAIGILEPRQTDLRTRLRGLNNRIDALNNGIDALNNRIGALNARIRAVNARQANLNALIAEQEQINAM